MKMPWWNLARKGLARCAWRVVETHAERGHVGAELGRGRGELRARMSGSKLRIGNIAPVAIRKTEMQWSRRARRHTIQFVRRNVVAEQVAPIVGEPQRSIDRTPVESDRIANALCNDRLSASIGLDPLNVVIPAFVALANIARCAYRDIEISVRSECDEFPAVMRFTRESIGDERRCG